MISTEKEETPRQETRQRQRSASLSHGRVSQTTTTGRTEPVRGPRAGVGAALQG